MSVETARAIVVLSTCDHADQVRCASCCITYMGMHHGTVLSIGACAPRNLHCISAISQAVGTQAHHCFWSAVLALQLSGAQQAGSAAVGGAVDSSAAVHLMQ